MGYGEHNSEGEVRQGQLPAVCVTVLITGGGGFPACNTNPGYADYGKLDELVYLKITRRTSH